MLWTFAPFILCPFCDVARFPYGEIQRAAFLPTPWGGIHLPYQPRGMDLFVDGQGVRHMGTVRPEMWLRSIRMDGGRSGILIAYGQPIWWGSSVWGGFSGYTPSSEQAFAGGVTVPGGWVVGGQWHLAPFPVGVDTVTYRWIRAKWGGSWGGVSGLWETGGAMLEGRLSQFRARWWREGWIEGGIRMARIWVGLGGWGERVRPWLDVTWDGIHLEARGFPEGYEVQLTVERSAQDSGFQGRVRGFWWKPWGGQGVWGGDVQIAVEKGPVWGRGVGVGVSDFPTGYPLQAGGEGGIRGVYREAHEWRVGVGSVWMGGSQARPDRWVGVGLLSYHLGRVFWILFRGGWSIWMGMDRFGMMDEPWFLQLEIGAWIADG